MKGLLIKDLKLMMVQKNSIIVILVLGLFFLFSDTNAAFGASYVTILVSIFTLSTVSYDEFDNGMSFLMTLPVSRGMYVREKYLMGLLGIAISWLFSSGCLFFVYRSKGIEYTMDTFTESIGLLAGAVVLISITLPLRLKYGSEKYRIAMLIGVGIIMLIGFIAAGAVKLFRIDLSGLVNKIEGIIPVLLAVSGILILGISYGASMRIMEKKEF